MAETKTCPKCGAELSPDAPAGICPKCLMQAGLGSQATAAQDAGASTPLTPDERAAATVRPSPRFPTPYLETLARQFPQLEILELLGQGGMGVVYKARQRELNRLVAVKILPPSVGDDPTFAERFTREAQALALLNHPNIVQVYDFGRTDEFFYFVMEYVDGVNLRALIREGKLKPEEALRIVPQICEALQFAHDEGIVHRDIKPENILIDKKGRVKIADFGLAKLLGRAAEDLSLTGTGQLMGTLGYMAPEQLQQAHSVDHRADIYSLGVVFYEMLTGQLPIGRFEPPSKRVHVDVRLDEIVLRSLESEPDRRYQHASDLKSDLTTIESGPAVVSSRPQTGDVGSSQTGNLPGALQFSLPNVHGGFSAAQGMLRMDDQRLTLESQVDILGFGFLKSAPKEVIIPRSMIGHVTLHEGWIRTVLSIRVANMSALAGVPTSTAGQVDLQIAKSDRALAKRYCAALNVERSPEPLINPIEAARNPAAAEKPPQPSTSVTSFAAWWSGRDKWFAKSVKAALLIVYVFCIIMVFSFQAASSANGWKIEIGRPSPWYVVEQQGRPPAATSIRSGLQLSSAWLIAGAGLLSYYLYWRIKVVEKGRTSKFATPLAHVLYFYVLAAVVATLAMILTHVLERQTPALTPKSTSARTCGPRANVSASRLREWTLRPDGPKLTQTGSARLSSRPWSASVSYWVIYKWQLTNVRVNGIRRNHFARPSFGPYIGRRVSLSVQSWKENAHRLVASRFLTFGVGFFMI